MSGGCLGDAVAALVDGELDHGARERAQRHLSHCAACRAEVASHRRLKARLAAAAPEALAPGDVLLGRLLALPVPGTESPAALPSPPARPVTLRGPVGPRGSRPAGRRASLRRRQAAAGSAVAVLGVLALALGGPQRAATTPVDPATDTFVVQHVDTTSDAPRTVRASLIGGGSGR